MHSPLRPVHDPEPLTSHLVVHAFVNRLHAFVENPIPLSVSHPQTLVKWILGDVLWSHLSVITDMLHEQPVSNMLADIKPFINDALGFVQKYLEMNWNIPHDRHPLEESVCYRRILEAITKLHNDEHIRDLITPTFVRTLTSSFSRLIDDDDWENTVSRDVDVPRCRDMLVKLRSSSSPQVHYEASAA